MSIVAVPPENKPRIPSSFLPITRRKFFRLAAAAGVAAITADAALIEPNYPRVVSREIGLRRWPAQLDGFRIVQLSDFHYDPFFSVHPLHASIDVVNALRPDLVVLTGDYVTLPLFSSEDPRPAAMAEPCARLLGRLQATHGLWAILGNHDFSTDPRRVAGALADERIQVLANQSVAIERNGAHFWLAGVTDVLSGTADLISTLRQVPADDAVVLLAHEPDYADYVARYAVDLQLSGHSHGGQVRLPFVRPLYLPELARKYIWGQYRIGPLTLYTNPGLGTIRVPVRWNCPAEITLLTVRRASA